jgi:N,N'-diacetyllegionaminate synthase
MVFVIAEIGVNWDGDFDLLEEMVSKAKEYGCNAVKFQAYNQELVKEHPEYKRLMRTTILPNNIDKVDEIVKNVGIEWFCTPMYSEAVKMLDPYVKRFKLRELDGRQLLKNNRTKLFEEVQKTNKEIIISSEKSPKNCQYYNTKNIKWLYCIPKYPCELNELDFRDFDIFDGFSNHTNNIMAPLTSIIKGGKILEIHITSDKKNNFIDNNVSFNYEELKMLMGLIKSAKKITIN